MHECRLLEQKEFTVSIKHTCNIGANNVRLRSTADTDNIVIDYYYILSEEDWASPFPENYLKLQSLGACTCTYTLVAEKRNFLWVYSLSRYMDKLAITEREK